MKFSRDLVFASDDACHRKFSQKFNGEIESFIHDISETHRRVERAMLEWPKNQRTDHLKLFLHTALNSLYCSIHFLVSGYMQPAGQQLRCHAEAVAMALLMLVDAEWKRFIADRGAYPVHKAMDRVTRRTNAGALRWAIGFDLAAWRDFQTIQEFYHHHSHAGAMTLAMNLKLEWPGATILGGEYDPAKREEYRDDIRRAASGARSLATLTEALEAHARTLVA